MPYEINAFADPRTSTAILALLVSFFSLLISWRSGKRAARALSISESQERRRQPRLGVYLVRGYRRRGPNRQLFGFLVSVTNPTDSNNSIARAELQIVYLLEDNVSVAGRVPHLEGLGKDSLADATGVANVLSLPARIDAHQTLSGWFLFALGDSVIGRGTVDSHRLILEDAHGISTDTGPIMVREWSHEGEED
jgi:hypothetical protein